MRWILTFVLALAGAAAQACGPNTDCTLGDRHYRIANAKDAPAGAIVFAHGYRGSARGTMKNLNMRNMAKDMGLALIAVKSLRDDWAIPNAPSDYNSDGSSEFAYFEAVLEDAEKRFGLDRDQVMMTGFSAGGMMVWELACNRPNLFAGFAPVAGTFWKEPPSSCAAPASVVHIHGTTDRTVPLTGRAIGPTRQGNVFETLGMYREFGGYGATAEANVGKLACINERNAEGDILEFCTHPGGHSFSREYLRFAWQRLEAAGRL